MVTYSRVALDKTILFQSVQGANYLQFKILMKSSLIHPLRHFSVAVCQVVSLNKHKDYKTVRRNVKANHTWSHAEDYSFVVRVIWSVRVGPP